MDEVWNFLGSVSCQDFESADQNFPDLHEQKCRQMDSNYQLPVTRPIFFNWTTTGCIETYGSHHDNNVSIQMNEWVNEWLIRECWCDIRDFVDFGRLLKQIIQKYSFSFKRWLISVGKNLIWFIIIWNHRIVRSLFPWSVHRSLKGYQLEGVLFEIGMSVQTRLYSMKYSYEINYWFILQGILGR
jgi:hypothetical protein